ncbi:MAG: hypothetical protein GY757_06610 [bacterium]|nr:hypothetical protein [bacterium]
MKKKINQPTVPMSLPTSAKDRSSKNRYPKNRSPKNRYQSPYLALIQCIPRLTGS